MRMGSVVLGKRLTMGAQPRRKLRGVDRHALRRHAVQGEQKVEGFATFIQAEVIDIEEVEFFRKSEILLEEPVSGECVGGIRDDAFLRTEADGKNGVCR